MKLSVGIDIGGTGTKLGIVNDDGKILAKKEFDTWTFNDFEDYVKHLSRLITSMSKDIPHELQGIGIGAPMGNFVDGTIDHPSNLPWKGVIPIVDLLKKDFDLPIIQRCEYCGIR